MKKNQERESAFPQRRRNYLRELNGNSSRRFRGEKSVAGATLSDSQRQMSGSRPMYEVSQRTRRRHESAHFERYASEGNRFIHEVAEILGTDNHAMALRITRAVLHAVRDRITPDDAVEFSQGLPTMLKALYFEEYDISRTPVNIRQPKEFIRYIKEKNRFAAARDFPDEESVMHSLHAVFTVLQRHLDPGQITHVKHLLNVEIRSMIENG